MVRIMVENRILEADLIACALPAMASWVVEKKNQWSLVPVSTNGMPQPDLRLGKSLGLTIEAFIDVCCLFGGLVNDDGFSKSNHQDDDFKAHPHRDSNFVCWESQLARRILGPIGMHPKLWSIIHYLIHYDERMFLILMYVQYPWDSPN